MESLNDRSDAPRFSQGAPNKANPSLNLDPHPEGPVMIPPRTSDTSGSLYDRGLGPGTTSLPISLPSPAAAAAAEAHRPDSAGKESTQSLQVAATSQPETAGGSGDMPQDPPDNTDPPSGTAAAFPDDEGQPDSAFSASKGQKRSGPPAFSMQAYHTSDVEPLEPTGKTFDDTVDAVAAAAQEILADRIHEAVADEYALPVATSSVPSLDREELQGVSPGERTGSDVAHAVAADLGLERIDRKIRAISARLNVSRNEITELDINGLNDRAILDIERTIEARVAMQEILARYGVEPGSITFVDERAAAMLTYKNNFVHVTSLDTVTQVTAWNSQSSPVERDRIETEHDKLVKQGAANAHLHHYLQTGNLPPHLVPLQDVLEADRETIEAAFQEHSQQVRQHATSHGFRQFQIHSPGLRLSLPVALHLLEQPVTEVYDIAGDYSATNGIIAVSKPGFFSHIHKPEVAWLITHDGRIEPAGQLS